MKKQVLNLVVAAFVWSGLIAGSALAQEKAKAPTQEKAKAEKGAAAQKIIVDNEKVRVIEATFKPGDENKAVPSASSRVVRALKGGTLLRTYADGKTQKVEWKTGEARFVEAEKTAFTTKNVGKTEVQLYVVVLK